MKKKYCSICGSELPIVKNKYFNQETGKQDLIYGDCLIRDCAHHYHDTNFFGRCRKCGRVIGSDF